MSNVEKEINVLADWTFDCWVGMANTLGLKSNSGSTHTFNMWTPGDAKFLNSLRPGQFESMLRAYDATMVTMPFAVGFEDEGVIAAVNTSTYYSYEEFFHTLLKVRMDYDKFKEYTEIVIRHEIGHALQFQEFVGKTFDDFGAFFRDARKDYDSMPRLRKNASNKSSLEWKLKYHKIPAEADANRRVGLTEDDIIKSFWLIH